MTSRINIWIIRYSYWAERRFYSVAKSTEKGSSACFIYSYLKLAKKANNESIDNTLKCLCSIYIDWCDNHLIVMIKQEIPSSRSLTRAQNVQLQDRVDTNEHQLCGGHHTRPRVIIHWSLSMCYPTKNCIREFPNRCESKVRILM